MSPLVAFDESGNTGQNLLDPAQPVFALASVLLSDEDARSLLALATPPGASEAKFSRLRGSGEGRRRLVAFFESPLLPVHTVKLSIFHKPFLATTKIVDLLVEPMAHAAGHNLYEKRGNLALANLLHAVTSSFCGQAAFESLQERFVAMVRNRDATTVQSFYDQLTELRRCNKAPEFDGTLRMLAATRPVAESSPFGTDGNALDPAVPTFFDLASQWTATLQQPSDVMHDASKPLARERAQLELVMTEAHPPTLFTRGGVKRQLPLLAKGVAFGDSIDVPQIQVADLIAGAAAAVCAASVRGRDDDLRRALTPTKLWTMIDAADPVWPTDAIDPSELGVGDDEEALDVVADIVASELRRRRWNEG